MLASRYLFINIITMMGLIYVNMIGKNADDKFIYEFYFSDEPEMAWGVDWDQKTPSICNISVPQRMNYDTIKILKTTIVLDVAQKNNCFSMQDCKDGVLAIAWENIDGYDEYPEDGRIVLPFGVEFDDTKDMLSKRGMFFEEDNDEF